MSGAVARAGDDLEAPDAVARREADVRRPLHLRPAAGELALDDVLAGQDAGVELAEQHLHVGPELLLQALDRTDVIAVPVGEGDPADLAARGLRGPDQVVGTPAERRVDEREAVIFADQVGVHEAIPSQLNEILVQCAAVHRFTSIG